MTSHLHLIFSRWIRILAQKSLMNANPDAIDMASVLNLQNNMTVVGNIGYTGAVSQIVVPTLTTSAVTNVTSTTADCGGNITDTGGAAKYRLRACGVHHLHLRHLFPTKTTNGPLTGSFTSQSPVWCQVQPITSVPMQQIALVQAMVMKSHSQHHKI